MCGRGNRGRADGPRPRGTWGASPGSRRGAALAVSPSSVTGSELGGGGTRQDGPRSASCANSAQLGPALGPCPFASLSLAATWRDRSAPLTVTRESCASDSDVCIVRQPQARPFSALLTKGALSVTHTDRGWWGAQAGRPGTTKGGAGAHLPSEPSHGTGTAGSWRPLFPAPCAAPREIPYGTPARSTFALGGLR